jgi:hypothetical protein
MDVKSIQTLDQLIFYGRNSDYSIHKLAFLVKVDDNVFISSLPYEKYDKLIKSRSQTIELTPEQLHVYAYRPDLMSTVLYGTPLLSHLILYLNGGAAYKFNHKTVTLLPASEVNNILQAVLNHEADRIKRNQADVLTP